jgi:SAM-dependent methyltransferase
MLDSSPAVFDHLLTENAVVLDYGSGRGAVLQRVGNRVRKGIGVELDERLVETANRINCFDHIEYVQGDGKNTLPFDSSSFDIILAMDVLEHVGDERPYLREFYRLLRPNGSLVVEVPAKGPFRALDIGNIKYNFPRLHRWFYHYVARQPDYYEQNFSSSAAMFGQFSRDATEHRHYSVDQLKKLTEPDFRLERYELVSFFFELIQFLEVLACKPFGRSSAKLFIWLMRQDAKIRFPLGRAYFIGIFKKNGEPPPTALPGHIPG